MDAEETKEAMACLGTEGMMARTARYMRQALAIDVDARDIPPGGVLEHLHAEVHDYMMARRRVCRRIAADRSEGGHIMRSLRTDPLIEFKSGSTYNPLGRRAEFPLAVEVEELEKTERRLLALAIAWKKDQERS